MVERNTIVEVGLALEPSALDESLIELNRRGLTSGQRGPVGCDGATDPKGRCGPT